MGPRERITRRQKNTSRLLRERKQVQKDKIKIKTFKKESAGRSYVGTFMFVLVLVIVVISAWHVIKAIKIPKDIDTSWNEFKGEQ